jgi:hypothetical protein
VTNTAFIVRLADWKWACIAGLALLGIAFFVLLVIHPGGFEGQIGWFLCLRPGAIPSAYLADMVYRIVPWAEKTAQWLAIVVISFLWSSH